MRPVTMAVENDVPFQRANDVDGPAVAGCEQKSPSANVLTTGSPGARMSTQAALGLKSARLVVTPGAVTMLDPTAITSSRAAGHAGATDKLTNLPPGYDSTNS